MPSWKLVDAKGIEAKFFRAGQSYEYLGRELGNCSLLRAEDGRPSWICTERFERGG